MLSTRTKINQLTNQGLENYMNIKELEELNELLINIESLNAQTTGMLKNAIERLEEIAKNNE